MSRKIRSSNQVLGILILIIGALLLLKEVGGFLPYWLFTWPMILIVIGLYTGVKNGFQNIGAVILLLVGVYFLLKDKVNLPVEVGPYLLPAALIFLGLYILFRRKKKLDVDWKDWEGNYDRWERKLRTGKASKEREEGKGDNSGFLNVEALFCGIKRKVISKHFRGGEVTTVFGGTDINLLHADIEDQAVLNLSVVFGGVKLLIPAHWDVQIGLSNVAAGVEDKRYLQQGAVDPNKKLILTGSVVFGGVEITSY